MEAIISSFGRPGGVGKSSMIMALANLSSTISRGGPRGYRGNGDKDKDRDLIKQLEKTRKESEVSLSGLLDFINGLWSTCVSECLMLICLKVIQAPRRLVRVEQEECRARR
ncbi:hypothetical protein Hanom_Chr04g00315431 [Helianthus anomalus]